VQLCVAFCLYVVMSSSCVCVCVCVFVDLSSYGFVLLCMLVGLSLAWWCVLPPLVCPMTSRAGRSQDVSDRAHPSFARTCAGHIRCHVVWSNMLDLRSQISHLSFVFTQTHLLHTCCICAVFSCCLLHMVFVAESGSEYSFLLSVCADIICI
jgi:hypothetical protein